MKKVGLILLGIVALVAPPAALGHPILVRTVPAFSERLASPPRQIVLKFTEPVDAFPGSIEIRRASGELVASSTQRHARVTVLRERLSKLPRGAYTVRWHTVSEEGHAVTGVFTFGVKQSAPPVMQAVGAAGPTTVDHLLRWVYFAGLALLIGGIAFQLFVLPASAPPARPFFVLTMLGGIASIEAGIAGFLLRARDALQVPLSDLIYSDLSPFADDTRFGTAFLVMTLALVVVVSLLFFTWITRRSALLWPAFAIAVGLASGLSYASHAAVNGRAGEFADWVHVVTAMLWLGGLVHLTVWISRAPREARSPVFMRFSGLTAWVVGVLVVAGMYLATLRLVEPSDLWRQGYGRVLLLKGGFVGIALAWGAFHRLFVGPALARSETPRLLRLVPCSLAGEGAVVTLALLIAAVLVDSSPPR